MARLDANEAWFGPFPQAVVAAQAAASFAHRYPELGADLLEALAARHAVPVDAIALGNGADALIGLICAALLRPGDECVMPDPSYVSYAQDTLRARATPVAVPVLADGRLDLPAMAAAVGPSTRLVFVCNPNNPTGGMCTAAELDAFLDNVPAGVVVVVDEAYAEYIDAPDYPDGPALTRTRPNVAVLRTFSKLFGLAGLRIGYVIGPLLLVDAVNALRHWYDVSDAAILAASASLEDPAEVTRRQQMTREARDLLVATLEAFGLTPLPSVGPFVVVPVDDADGLAERFLRHAVVVRPYPHANGTFIRIAVGGEEDLRQVQTALVALSADDLFG